MTCFKLCTAPGGVSLPATRPVFGSSMDSSSSPSLSGNGGTSLDLDGVQGYEALPVLCFHGSSLSLSLAGGLHDTGCLTAGVREAYAAVTCRLVQFLLL